jgi:hypothetical protein
MEVAPQDDFSNEGDREKISQNHTSAYRLSGHGACAAFNVLGSGHDVVERSFIETCK